MSNHDFIENVIDTALALCQQTFQNDWNDPELYLLEQKVEQPGQLTINVSPHPYANINNSVWIIANEHQGTIRVEFCKKAGYLQDKIATIGSNPARLFKPSKLRDDSLAISYVIERFLFDDVIER